MTQFRLKNSTVDAVQYRGQNVDELPDFVRHYKGFTPTGMSSVGRNLVGTLLVPHPGGYWNAVPSDWLVFDGKVLRVVRNHEFDDIYEPIEHEPAPVLETLAPIPQPAPGSAADVPQVEPVTAASPAPVSTETTSDASQQ